MKSSQFLGGLAIFIAISGCGPMNEDDSSSASRDCTFTESSGHAIDPFKELLVVDDAVVEDDAAKNASDGALGFRHAIEAIADSPGDASAMTLAWLDAWAPPSFECAWLRARPENACDASCGSCTAREVDLSLAPFRLMAVSNRLDLADEEQSAGEGRLLFAATDGAGDDAASPALPMTVIFEFHLRGRLRESAARWHALGERAEFDAQYMQNVLDLTANFATRSSLAQIRVDDEESDSNGRMLEFHLDSAAPAANRIARAKLGRTPPHSLDGSSELAAFIDTEHDQVLADTYRVPDSMLADGVELGQAWTLPGTEESLRRAFAAGTCDGCHGSEHTTIDGGFHVSPFQHGTAKLSRFLFDPADRAGDELTRRASVLSDMACRP